MSNKLSLLVNFVGVDKLSGSIRNISAMGRKGSRSLGEIRTEGRKLESQLREVRRELGSASGNITELARSERDLEQAIERTNRELDQRQRLLAVEGDRRSRVARGEAWQAKGRDNIVQGASLAAPIILAGKAAMDYDQELRGLAQTMDLTKAEQESLGRSMLIAADKSKRMADDVLGGAAFLGSKGATADQLKGMMPQIARFSTAWGTEVVDSSKAAYAAQLSLGVGIKDTGRALEIMAAAGKAGGFEVRDMAQHFPVLASSLAALGYDGLPAVSDLSAALQVLEAKTGDGAQAATNLKNLMAFPMSEMGIKRFQKFGINVSAALKKAEAEGRSPLETLISLTEKATGGDAMRIGELFSNQQAAEAMRALMAEKKQYLDIRREALASQGLTEAEFQRMAEGSSANWTKLKNSVATLAITFGDKLLPTINIGVQKITSIVGFVGNWAAANPELAATLIQIVAGLAVFKLGVGAAQLVLGTMLGPLGSAIALYRKFMIVGSLAKLFPTLATGMRLAGLALRFMLGPVGLVITGLALLGVAVYSNWDKIKAAFMAGKAWLSNFGSNMLAVGKQIVLGLARGIAGSHVAVWNALKKVVMGGVGKVKNWLGIKSPSRVFMQIGAHTGEGMAIGMDRQGKRVASAAGRLAAGAVAAGSMALASPSLATARPASQGSAAPVTMNVTIKIDRREGESEEAFAQRIADRLRRIAERAARGSYEDDV